MEDVINLICKKYDSKEKGNLIPVLQDIQKEEGYISAESVRKVSRYLRVPRSQIYGVTSFYTQFKFNPPGRHSIRVCVGTACHVQGSEFILKAVEAELGISNGETTEDRRFDLDSVACLGCCALAPVVMIDKKIYGRMSVIKLKDLLSKYE